MTTELSRNPSEHLLSTLARTTYGEFSICSLSFAELIAAGFGVHHISPDRKFIIVSNGKEKYAIYYGGLPQQENEEKEV